MSHHAYEEMRQKYIEFWLAGNGAGIAALFTDDCLLIPPDNPLAMGKAGVQAFYEEQFSFMTPLAMSANPEEEVVLGDWGYGVGSWAVTAMLKATGATVQVEGKYKANT